MKNLLFAFLFISQVSNLLSQADCNTYNWENFAKSFTDAVKTENKAKIQSLTDFTVMSLADFNENYDLFFLSEFKKRILKSKLENLGLSTEELNGSKATCIRKLLLVVEEKDEDGDTVEFSNIYYFGWTKDGFKLLALVEAD